jgi:hypothetical protein
LITGQEAAAKPRTKPKSVEKAAWAGCVSEAERRERRRKICSGRYATGPIFF